MEIKPSTSGSKRPRKVSRPWAYNFDISHIFSNLRVKTSVKSVLIPIISVHIPIPRAEQYVLKLGNETVIKLAHVTKDRTDSKVTTRSHSPHESFITLTLSARKGVVVIWRCTGVDVIT